MIQVDLTHKEIKIILESLKNCNDRELYCKFWRILFNKGVKV